MRDGTAYTGDFNDGEITGKGVKTYPSDHKLSQYLGDFKEGEMHGNGLLIYNTNLK